MGISDRFGLQPTSMSTFYLNLLLKGPHTITLSSNWGSEGRNLVRSSLFKINNYTILFISVPGLKAFFVVVVYLFTCAYIVWVISPPCPPPLSFPPPLLSFRQVLFCPFTDFVEERTYA
jgi:hypothetical protein